MKVYEGIWRYIKVYELYADIWHGIAPILITPPAFGFPPLPSFPSLATLEPCNLEKVQRLLTPWNLKILEAWNLHTLKPEALASRVQGFKDSNLQEPWNLEAKSPGIKVSSFMVSSLQKPGNIETQIYGVALDVAAIRSSSRPCIRRAGGPKQKQTGRLCKYLTAPKISWARPWNHVLLLMSTLLNL